MIRIFVIGSMLLIAAVVPEPAMASPGCSAMQAQLDTPGGTGSRGGAGFLRGDVITVSVTRNTNPSLNVTWIQDATNGANLTGQSPGSYTYTFSVDTNDSVGMAYNYQPALSFFTLTVSCAGP